MGNIIKRSDAYKHTHWPQYPKGLEYLYSYLESRGGLFPETVMYGLQIIMKKHLVGQVVSAEKIDEADEFCQKVFGANYFNRKGWEHILYEHNGYLPVRITAVPEGTLVPNHNVLVTMENTDPKVPWLTNFLETILMQTWYPITVCTMSYNIKKIIRKWGDLTGSEVSPFHLNDFGFRGVSSTESAGIGGSAHLVNFMGTDTLEAIEYAMKYYGGDVCGYSVPATEHSTITVYGKDGEQESYEAMLDAFPSGILSIVSDSWDIYNAVNYIFGKKLRDKILARDGKLVIRPDSGDPVEVTINVVDALWKAFGGTVNQKGYRVLNPAVGVIYGDGINYKTIDIICQALHNTGYAIENVIFGQGGGLLQQVDRDTFKFAFKASSAVVDGMRRDVYKQPITDAGKNSKKGRLKLLNYQGKLMTVCATSYDEDNELVPVFENGRLLQEYNFQEIRDRVEGKSNQNFKKVLNL